MPGGHRFERGLFPWEKRALEAPLFPRKGHVLVGAAGAGRELVALLERGYSVTAFDPCAAFVEGASALCRDKPAAFLLGSYGDLVDAAEGRGGPLASLLDAAPFDAVILGWGSLSHVLPAASRRALLHAVRRVAPRAPVLASFMVRHDTAASPDSKGRVRDALRRVFGALGAPGPSEVGDCFFPEGGFFSYLSPEEIPRVAFEAGYEVVFFEEGPYPHVLLAPMTTSARPEPEEIGLRLVVARLCRCYGEALPLVVFRRSLWETLMQHVPSTPKKLLATRVILAAAGLAACALPGCSNEAPVGTIDFVEDTAPPSASSDQVVVADFVMHVSPRDKKVSIERLVRDESTGLLRPQSIDELTLQNDGTAGIGPPNTVELVTNSYNENTACPSGTSGVWCVNVTLRHFYGRPISNAFVQVTSIDLANHAATNGDGSEFGLDDTKGLWKYTADASANLGVLGMSPNNTARAIGSSPIRTAPRPTSSSASSRASSTRATCSTALRSPSADTDACNGGTNLGTALTGTTTPPVARHLYSTTNSKVNFSRRGVITLGSTSAPPLGNNVDLPSASGVRPGIFPFWDELHYGTGGSMCHRVIGTAPNRQFVDHLEKHEVQPSDR